MLVNRQMLSLLLGPSKVRLIEERKLFLNVKIVGNSQFNVDMDLSHLASSW